MFVKSSMQWSGYVSDVWVDPTSTQPLSYSQAGLELAVKENYTVNSHLYPLTAHKIGWFLLVQEEKIM